ncbi:hypothetical protein TNCV_4181441 [Trichonephila clavipes]|nr:hypothetical protein TNCV_4181441 [Trichonephila clavipes]
MRFVGGNITGVTKTYYEVYYIIGNHMKTLTDAENVKECFLSASNLDRRTASLLVRLQEGEERWEAPGHLQVFLPLNWGRTEQNSTVTCRVFKAKANDKRKILALFRDELRDFQPDFVRQAALVTKTTTLLHKDSENFL